jgi:hypothetical protein
MHIAKVQLSHYRTLSSCIRATTFLCFPLSRVEILDKGVVLVRCGINWGAGILVDRNTGTFLTCSHVVAEVRPRILVTRAQILLSPAIRQPIY